jgi:hypothetical protein
MGLNVGIAIPPTRLETPIQGHRLDLTHGFSRSCNADL